MTNTIDPSFIERYRESLKLHLANQTPECSSLRVAHLLGHDAANAEINVLELIRIHDQVLTKLASPSALKKKFVSNSHFSPATAFLIEVLKPLDILDSRDAEAQADNEMTADDIHQSCRDELGEVTQRYNQLLTESKQVQRESQKLAHQILIAHEEERKEISRELHDELAQTLAAINVRLAVLTQTSRINDRSFTKNILKTQKLVEESVDMVHRFAYRLRPAILDDLGLIPALRSYIKGLRGRKELDIHFSSTAEVEKLDSMRQTVLYRVTQEALLNIARHAEAKSATVKLGKTQNGVRLEVRDDGKSFQMNGLLSIKTHQRLGLLGMRERVEMVGGQFSIVSEKGKGTTVCAVIPFFTSEEDAL